MMEPESQYPTPPRNQRMQKIERVADFMAQFSNPEPEWRSSAWIAAAIHAGVVSRQAIQILTAQQRERGLTSAEAARPVAAVVNIRVDDPVVVRSIG